MFGPLENYYTEEWRFFRSRLSAIILCLGILFALAAVYTHAHWSKNPQELSPEVSSLVRSVDKIVPGDGKEDWFSRGASKFLRSLRFSLQVVLCGFIPFLLMPAWAVVHSGYFLGLLFSLAQMTGLWGSVLVSLMPHALFETLGLLYCSSIGVYISIEMSKKILPKYRNRTLPFSGLFYRIVCSYVLVLIPLMGLSAILETVHS